MNKGTVEGRGTEEIGEKGEGIKKYKLPDKKIVTGM